MKPKFEALVVKSYSMSGSDRDADSFVFRSTDTTSATSDHDHKDWVDILTMSGGGASASQIEYDVALLAAEDAWLLESAVLDFALTGSGDF